MPELMSDQEHEYLMAVLTDIDGVGKKTATDIISLRDSFAAFESVGTEALTEVSHLGDDSAKRVVQQLQRVDFDKDISILEIERVLRKFLDRQYELLNNITLDKLDINVLLVKALGFTTVEEVIEFYLYQRITRSATTAWGTEVEKIVLAAGTEKIPHDENVSVGGKKFDMKKETDETAYYIQLKSGPNTMNVGMVNSLNEMIARIEEQHTDATGMLGMTYGTKEQISNQIKGNLDAFEQKALIGADFWEFISEERGYFTELIAVIDTISEQFESRYERTYFDLAEKKEQELQAEWREKYGAIGSEGLTAFVETYTS